MTDNHIYNMIFTKEMKSFFKFDQLYIYPKGNLDDDEMIPDQRGVLLKILRYWVKF